MAWIFFLAALGVAGLGGAWVAHTAKGEAEELRPSALLWVPTPGTPRAPALLEAEQQLHAAGSGEGVADRWRSLAADSAQPPTDRARAARHLLRLRRDDPGARAILGEAIARVGVDPEVRMLGEFDLARDEPRVARALAARLDAGGEELASVEPGFRARLARELAPEVAAPTAPRSGSPWPRALVVLGIVLVLLTSAGLCRWIGRRAAVLDERQSSFLYSVTHELKTPLATISLCAETLEQHGADDPGAVPRFATMIRDEAERLRLRLQRVLDVAAGRRDGLEADARFDAVAMLHATVADYLPGAGQAGVRLSLEAPDTPLVVAGPSELFAQAVGGLLENAIKFGGPGAVSVRAAAANGSRLAVDVADEGPGVPPAEAERIFRPFVRGESVGSIHGTGLGLPLVRQCADALLGTVRLLPSRGRGATFRLELPLLEPSS